MIRYLTADDLHFAPGRLDRTQKNGTLVRPLFLTVRRTGAPPDAPANVSIPVQPHAVDNAIAWVALHPGNAFLVQEY